MPTTAATMNVRIGADIAPLRQGLKAAQASVDQSAKLMSTSFATTATATDGSRVATEFLRGLKAEFSAANVQLKAQLFQGQLSAEQFRVEGQKVAEQFNVGLTAGMKQFGAAGILTPAVEARLVNSYKRAGLNSGDALASGLTRSVIPATQRAQKEFGFLGERGVKAGLMGGVAMSQLALDIGSTESASHKVVHAVSDIALMFGSEGLLVAGVLNAGLVMKQFFDKAQSDADATAKKFRDSIGSLVDAGDIAELTRQKSLIDYGTPSAGVGKGGAFKGGLKDLLAREAELSSRTSIENRLPRRTGNRGLGAASSDATNIVMSSAADSKTLADIRAQISVLIANKKEIEKSIAIARSVPKLLLPGGGDTAGGAAAAAGAGADPMTSLISQSNTLLGLQKDVADGGEPIIGLNNRLLDNLVTVNAALAEQSDQFGEVALKLRGVRAGLLGATDAARGSLVSVTPGAESPSTALSVPSVLAGIPDQDKNIDLQNLPTIPGKLDTLGTIFRESIASQAQFIAQSLTTVLGIKQANAGGAIGSVLGGAVGEGVGKSVVGSAAGGIVGTVVPVVGTIVGSIVGGAIGNAIGGLFSHHKKAVDNSATSLNALSTAAQKVAEVLSNVPQGFDVALARYNAARAGADYKPGAGYGIAFHGPVNIVANNPQELYDQLSNYQGQRNARGGTSSLSSALSPA